MAKIQEQAVVIRLSKLVKGDDKLAAAILPAETLEALESVVAELVGDQSVVVEVETADFGDED